MSSLDIFIITLAYYASTVVIFSPPKNCFLIFPRVKKKIKAAFRKKSHAHMTITDSEIKFIVLIKEIPVISPLSFGRV